MKLLSIHDGPYISTHAGSAKADRFMLEALAGVGYDCRALIPAHSGTWSPGTATLESDLQVRQIPFKSVLTHQEITFELREIQITAIAENSLSAFLQRKRFRDIMLQTIRDWSPDCIIVTGTDCGQNLLSAAIDACPGKVIRIVRSTPDLGFGPLCPSPNPFAAAVFKRASAILCPSRYLQQYINKWGGVAAVACDLPMYGTGPFQRYGDPRQEHITLVNPCKVKGITIFSELARQLPHLSFAAVPTWGTSRTDLAMLKTIPNVQLFEPVDDIDKLFSVTRILLMPSLWDEAFGRLCVEAMLRGIPVLASNVGGLPEAKLGVPYILPVNPIREYTLEYSDNGQPLPSVPVQDITLWLKLLKELAGNSQLLLSLSEQSRRAATIYSDGLTLAPFHSAIRGVTLDSVDPGCSPFAPL